VVSRSTAASAQAPGACCVHSAFPPSVPPSGGGPCRVTSHARMASAVAAPAPAKGTQSGPLMRKTRTTTNTVETTETASSSWVKIRFARRVRASSSGTCPLELVRYRPKRHSPRLDYPGRGHIGRDHIVDDSLCPMPFHDGGDVGWGARPGAPRLVSPFESARLSRRGKGGLRGWPLRCPRSGVERGDERT
jgi:hypothetical protein